MSKVSSLIAQFLDAMQDGRRAVWRQADLAAAIVRDDPQGLKRLHEASGLSISRLKAMVRTARAYVPAARFPLPFEHHIIALCSAGMFPVGSPEAQPAFWLQKAVAGGLTREGLRRAMRQHLQANATPAQRLDRAIQRYRDSEQAIAALKAQLETFNRVHSPFWGATLTLLEVPLSAVS